ncbi:hypothetical protein D3C76_1014100 [compost metagenome]
MDQFDVTRKARRGGHRLLVVEQHIARLGRVVIGQAFTQYVLMVEGHRCPDTPDVRDNLHHLALHAVATIASEVIPDHFKAVLGNGEWKRLGEVLQAIAAGDQAGIQGIFLRGLDDARRHVGATVGGIHVHRVFGVALEHGQLAWGQAVFVLVSALRGNGE